MKGFCQIGNHAANRSHLSSCYICHRTFCLQHKGNNPLVGDYLSCPDHVEQVKALNEKWWREFHKNNTSHS